MFPSISSSGNRPDSITASQVDHRMTLPLTSSISLPTGLRQWCRRRGNGTETQTNAFTFTCFDVLTLNLISAYTYEKDLCDVETWTPPVRKHRRYFKWRTLTSPYLHVLSILETPRCFEIYIQYQDKVKNSGELSLRRRFASSEYNPG